MSEIEYPLCVRPLLPRQLCRISLSSLCGVSVSVVGAVDPFVVGEFRIGDDEGMDRDR